MFANFYAKQMADVDYNKIYEFIKLYIEKEDKILDAGCGPGYLLKELVNNNYNAFGIDIDENMLKIATNKQKLYGLVFLHDMRNPLTNKFDVIISVFDVINYFKGVKGVFRNIYKGLNENGTFIFDIYNKEALNKMKGFFEFSNFYEWETWMEKEIINHSIITKDNKSYKVKQYGYDLNYYTNILEEIGFSYEVISGPDIRKHYIVAKKKKS